MQIKIHVPTKEYAFIEIEGEYTLAEATDLHDELSLLVADKRGLNASDWKALRMKMLKTGGEVDLNLEVSKAQRYWVNETKKTLRDIKNEI